MNAAHLEPVRRALGNVIDAPAEDVSGGFPGADAPFAPYGDDGGAANDRGGDRGRGGEKRPPKAMPDGCPVTPVGTENGVFYFLTALGELRPLAPDKVANKNIVAMFAPESDYLLETWPNKKLVPVTDEAGNKIKDPETGEVMTEWIITGWKNDIVAQLLMDVAAAKGVWNPMEKVRGTGAWRARDGSLILHAGSHILINGRWMPPGEYDGLVYPGAPPIPRPAPRELAHATGEQIAPQLASMLRARGVKIAADLSPAGLLLELVKLWNWERPQIDPWLWLGWQGAAMLGGALGYRPIIWVTGDAATGKTTLMQVMGWLHDGGILQSSKASEAGVRQVLGQRSLPVALDETEATEDNRKLIDLVTLARLAATSQGNILKGGQDHTGHEFRAETCFLFSSILVPPMPPADRSRIGMLELHALPKGARDPAIDQREINAIGAWMRRRMLDGWGRWPALLAEFRDALIGVGGHKGRGADQFGTLLAAMHLLLNGGVPDEGEAEALAEKLAVHRLAETADNTSDAVECVRHLRTSIVHLPGFKQAMGLNEWVLQASEPLEEDNIHTRSRNAEVKQRRAEAAKVLSRIGLKVLHPDAPDPEQRYLAVATSHQGLGKLFEGTRWMGGTWSQALGRVAGARRNRSARIGGNPIKATLVPLSQIATHEAGDEDEPASEDLSVGELLG